MTTETQKKLKAIQLREQRLAFQKAMTDQVKAAHLQFPVFEYQFHSIRKWQIDFAWPLDKLAVELEGGIYFKKGGGHRSISGFEANLEKYNALAIEGWYLIRILPEWLDRKNGKALDLIKAFFNQLDRRNALPID